MKHIKEGSSFSDYIETFLFFTPSIDSDNEDILELNLSFKSEDDNSTKKSTLKSVNCKNFNSRKCQKIKSCLLVIYDLYFIIFKNESNKNSFNKSNILKINRNDKNHKDCVNYLCSKINCSKSEYIYEIQKKLNKRFILFDSSIKIFMADINTKFTDFFNATNFNKNNIDNQVSLKKKVLKKNEKIIYIYNLGLIKFLFNFIYNNNNESIKLSSINLVINEKNEYAKFLFDKYINEYYLKGHNIHQMIVSFLILKEKYFSLFDYDYDYNKKSNKKNVSGIEPKITKKNILEYNYDSSILIELYLLEQENKYINESDFYKNLEVYWKENYNL